MLVSECVCVHIIIRASVDGICMCVYLCAVCMNYKQEFAASDIRPNRAKRPH